MLGLESALMKLFPSHHRVQVVSVSSAPTLGGSRSGLNPFLRPSDAEDRVVPCEGLCFLRVVSHLRLKM